MKSIININDIFSSNNNGNLKILNKVKCSINSKGYSEIKNSDRYITEFIDTGYVSDFSSNAIRKGRVKDKFYRSVANIGFIGSDIKITYHLNYYKSWNDMINRCYNPNDEDYYAYGNIGIIVDQRWFNFTNFLNDIKFLPGFQNKLKYPSEYQLDKDYLQLYIPKNKRIYSPQTCIWISKYDNIEIMNRDRSISNGEYFGVMYKDGSYCTKINNHIYGRFNNPLAAASLFNYIYPLLTRNIPFHDIFILNNIDIIPYDELINYTINKQSWLNDYPTWSTVQANWK